MAGTSLPLIDIFRPPLPPDPGTFFKVLVDSRDAHPQSSSHYVSYLFGYLNDMGYSGAKPILLRLSCRETRLLLADVGKPFMSQITQERRLAVVSLLDKHPDTIMDILPQDLPIFLKHFHQGHLKELYKVEVSPSLISAVTDAVLADVKAWQGRPLDGVYPIVYLDAIHVKVRSGGHVQTHAVYLALALTLEGNKELLGLWVGQAEGAKSWLSVLTELKNRGVEDILIAAIDGLKGFGEAIESVLPKTRVQLCIVHLVRGSLRFVAWKQRKAVARDLRTIYRAVSLEAAETALEAFSERWDERFPMISRKWRANWANLTPLFDYPPEIRKVMYTTNAIEALNAQLTKVTKKRGAFPTPEAVRKVLYLAIDRASQRWTRPVQDWTGALNHLSIVFEGRVPV